MQNQTDALREKQTMRKKPPAKLVPKTGSNQLRAKTIGTLMLTLLAVLGEESASTLVEMRARLERMLERGMASKATSEELLIVKEAWGFVNGVILTGGPK
jgi:hypothetical protein